MSNFRQNFITLILILMISIVPNLAKTNYHKKMCDGVAKIKGGHVAKRRNMYIFSNFPWMFLNPNIFSQFEL